MVELPDVRVAGELHRYLIAHIHVDHRLRAPDRDVLLGDRKLELRSLVEDRLHDPFILVRSGRFRFVDHDVSQLCTRYFDGNQLIGHEDAAQQKQETEYTSKLSLAGLGTRPTHTTSNQSFLEYQDHSIH